jgi:hypothetical protein
MTEGPPKPKGKVRNPENVIRGGVSKWVMEIAMFFNILAPMGNKEEKHSTQRSFVIMKKALAKNGYIC